ncbi:MAG: tetratricopeptide repeat protein [Kiritimatiellae bacterium]|nr:tetratricopeptide repeat protein [Kiritimatiellia bacterium]
MEKLAAAGCVAWGAAAWGQEASGVAEEVPSAEAAEAAETAETAEHAEVAEGAGGEQAVKRLAVGRAALEDGMWGLARRQFQSVLAESSDRRRQAEAALWLARVALAEGKPPEAVRLLAAHRGKVGASGPLAAGFALESARAAAASGKPESALEELEGFAGRHPGDAAVPAALRLAMDSAAELGRWDEAEAAGEALEGVPGGEGQDGNQAPGAWMALADRMAAAGETARARAALERVAEKWPEPSPWHGWALVRLAELDLEGGKLAGKAWLERLEGLDPAAEAASGGYRVAARALAAEGEYGAALEAAGKALSLARHPEDRLECQVLRARLMGAAGRGEEGAGLLREVAGRVPDESRAAALQLQLADWLEQAGRPEEAEAECRAWLEAFDGAEGTAGVHARLGRLLAAQGRLEEAADALERAVAAEGKGAARLALRLEEARLQAACGRHARAAEAFAEIASEAPAGSPEWGEARFLGAESRLAAGEEREAEIDWLDLSRSEPESAWTRAATARLGRMYEERGALDTAMEQYGRLVEGAGRAGKAADPAQTAAALMARGRIRYGLGAFQPALDDFLRIRREFPKSEAAPRALFMSGWCLYLLGKDEDAIAACERFLKEYPDSEFAPDVRFWLAEKAFNEGDAEVAEKRFAAVAADYPRSARAPEALYWAGRAAAARSAYLEANEHFNALMAGYPDSPRLPETLLSQGDVLCELGQFALAIVAFDEVAGRFPQSPEALMARGRKGDCQFTLGASDPGRYEEALMSYRALADFAGVPGDLALQARYKIGRCLEKLGNRTEALEQYLETAYSYLQEARPAAESAVWFTRAAFAAAALQERAGQWDAAVKTYRRVAGAGVPAAAEAESRIERIRQEHWTRDAE